MTDDKKQIEILSMRASMTPEDAALMKTLGSQVTVWCFGCDEAMIDAPEMIAGEMELCAGRNNLTVRDRCTTQFEPQGVTIVMILAESHMLVNTWPEHGVMQIELFSCRTINAEDLQQTAKAISGATRIYTYGIE